MSTYLPDAPHPGSPSPGGSRAHPPGSRRPGAPRPSGRGRRSSPWTWRWGDRLVLVCAWGAGLALCAIAAAIVIYMGYRGIQYLRPSLLATRPEISESSGAAVSGGLLDPLLGTLLLTLIGIVLALPLALGCAVWVAEYGRPSWLARAVESSIEVIAGTPDIVIALFGLAIFQLGILAPLSFRAEAGGVYGRSFFAAGAMMSLLALPLVVAATREGLAQIPAQMREASYALGKTRATTIRRVLLPSIRPSIASGATLGMGRIIGDTAIVVILLGSTLRLEGAGGLPVLSTLRGTGGTLTSYVFENSPAGEGNAPEKAYAAAFVLLMMVLALNMVVTRLSAGRPRWMAGLTGPMLWRWMPWSGR